MENVLAIRQPPDLLRPLEFVQANCAALRWVDGGGDGQLREVGEFDDGEEFAEEEGGGRRVDGEMELRREGVGVEEFREGGEAEKGVN